MLKKIKLKTAYNPQNIINFIHSGPKNRLKINQR